MRKLFVTTALPYANGAFHIGHIMEYIQADIWVRFQRMQGHEVNFVGADDPHGAPTLLAAENAGKSPEACENCSTVYSATELKNPYSVLSGAKPLLKSSEHHFFKLSDPKCRAFIKDWLETPGRLQPQVVNKAREWLEGTGDKALTDWDI